MTFRVRSEVLDIEKLRDTRDLNDMEDLVVTNGGDS